MYSSIAGSPETVVAAWMAIPFGLLLIAIAVGPLLSKHWWERHYAIVAIGLGVVAVGCYLLVLGRIAPILHAASEYISFIALIGSLFVISGGIHVRLRGKSSPLTNVGFLALGALLANVAGTTGASMILIRPYLRVNKYRVRPFHVVFFIFIVSNIGGALTPIGDPPLFLGYLKGIPFFWALQGLWHVWLLALVIVLSIFYVIDRRAFGRFLKHRHLHPSEIGEEARFEGAHNVFFLLVVLGAVFVTNPPFVREAIMVAAAIGSHMTTKREIHKANGFDFQPIQEVAILFVGIFATMVPALEWIRDNSGTLALQKQEHFYWTTGALSSVLDNAPTYLNLLNAAVGQFVDGEIIRQVSEMVQTHWSPVAGLEGSVSSEIRGTFTTLTRYHNDLVAAGNISSDQIATAYLLTYQVTVVQAISIGAVFFGAMTYIGNGPNFMVKSIAEQVGVQCPSFGAYVARYAVPVLLPTFILLWILFFRS